jgi:hypothetical protein
MGIEDRVGKHEVYKIITGKESHEILDYAGQIPNECEIKPEDVDRIFLAVKKMERCYHKEPDSYPVKKYYAHHFQAIESAYLSQDFEAFVEAAKSLASSIHAE